MELLTVIPIWEIVTVEMIVSARRVKTIKTELILITLNFKKITPRNYILGDVCIMNNINYYQYSPLKTASAQRIPSTAAETIPPA